MAWKTWPGFVYSFAYSFLIYYSSTTLALPVSLCFVLFLTQHALPESWTLNSIVLGSSCEFSTSEFQFKGHGLMRSPLTTLLKQQPLSTQSLSVTALLTVFKALLTVWNYFPSYHEFIKVIIIIIIAKIY